MSARAFEPVCGMVNGDLSEARFRGLLNADQQEADMKKRNNCSCSGLGLLLSCALLVAALTPSLNGQVNAVYVESNIAADGQNSILGYTNDGFGNMTPLPGSPYLTDGTGWAPPNGQPLGFQ